jgi:hypothetical protein
MGDFVNPILDWIAELIESIPDPFASMTNSLADLLGTTPALMQYLLNAAGFSEGLLIIGGGVAFFLGRKVLTLLQW